MAPANPRNHFAPHARRDIATRRRQLLASTHCRSSRHQPDTQKLRNEIRRLELLVKKLQAELEAQKQYCAALEADFKSMQETE